ncbi:MAG: twin-arginine translocase TatA/TatE family subunit [Pseudomonadota bacterium]
MSAQLLTLIPLPLGVFGLGSTELIIILVAILIVFGPSNLPKLADAMGKAIRNFKKSASGDEEEAGGKPTDKSEE